MTNKTPSPEETWEERLDEEYNRFYRNREVFKTSGDLKDMFKQFITQEIAKAEKRVAEEMTKQIKKRIDWVKYNDLSNNPLETYSNEQVDDHIIKELIKLAIIVEKYLTPTKGRQGSNMNNQPPSPEETLMEKFADIEHQRWADWQKYLHSCTHLNDRGEICFNSYRQFEHWKRQIETPYAELTEEEKESDRKQVKRYWSIIAKDLSQEIANAEKRVAEENKVKLAWTAHNIRNASEADQTWMDAHGRADEVVVDKWGGLSHLVYYSPSSQIKKMMKESITPTKGENE